MPTKLQKFAELLIQECINKIENEAAQYAEPVWAFELVNDIRDHFGVES
jgi:leucyl aminopeptidase (aminopeptidase T)